MERLNALLADLEKVGEPQKRVIEGCRHTLPRMLEWADNGACPVCLTASLGVAKEHIASLLSGAFVPAGAWLINRADGRKELIFAPLTDETFLDEGDEAVALYMQEDEGDN